MDRRPLDGPLAVDDNRDRPTGLLTRFVPDKLKHGALYRMLLRLTRVLQFLSAVISLAIFSHRLRKVHRLVNAIKRRRGVTSSYGAVEGILAAATLYTLITMLLSLLKRNSSPGKRGLRWLWVLLDLLFVGAFIAVATLTRPDGGNAGPRNCYSNRGDLRLGVDDDSCHLPWGTFILAIISTILHAITAAFHEVGDRRRARLTAVEEEKAIHQGHAGAPVPAPGTAHY